MSYLIPIHLCCVLHRHNVSLLLIRVIRNAKLGISILLRESIPECSHQLEPESPGERAESLGCFDGTPHGKTFFSLHLVHPLPSNLISFAVSINSCNLRIAGEFLGSLHSSKQIRNSSIHWPIISPSQAVSRATASSMAGSGAKTAEIRWSQMLFGKSMATDGAVP